MTKFCEVCKQTYPETEAQCPHCAAAAATHHQEPAQGAPVVSDPDSAVDLGSNPDIQLPPAPVAAAEEEPFVAEPDSSVNLVEEATSPPTAAEGSPDSNVLGHLFAEDVTERVAHDAEEEPFLAEPDSHVNVAAEASTPADAATVSEYADEPFVAEVDSGVNLISEASGRHLGEEADIGSAKSEVESAEADDDSSIDLAALVEEGAPSSSQIGIDKADSSGVNLTNMPVAAAESDAEPVDLASLSGETGEALEEPELPGAANASEPPMSEERRQALIRSDVVVKDDDASVLDDLGTAEAGGSSVNLGDAPVSGERPSSRDLIAEAVESGVDLGGGKSTPTEVVDEEPANAVTEVPDSGIDLGVPDASIGMPSSGPAGLQEAYDEAEGDAPGEAESAEALADDSSLDLSESFDMGQAPGTPPGSSEVDLGGETRKPAKPRLTSKSSSSKLDLDEPVDAALDDEEPAAAALDDEEPAAAALDNEAAAAAELDEEGAATSAERDQEEEPVTDAPDDKDEDAKPAKATKRKVPVPDDEDDETPSSKPVKPKYGRRWLAGGVMGALVGVATVIALWTFGIEPPAALRELAGVNTTPPAQPGKGGQPPQGGQQPQAGATAAELAAAQVKNGDFEKALPELDKLNPPSDEQLGQRGTARWFQYLKTHAQSGAPLNKDDQDVKTARADLEKAAEKNPEALLTLGLMQEATEPEAAIKTYQDGLQRFGATPKWKRTFESAVNRVQTRVAVGPAGGGVGLLDPARPDAAEALVALLIAFQGDNQPQSDADDEAGNEFWNAAKLARDGKFKEARVALENSRKLHDKVRFSRLRKAQNPLSDPTEEIFLRCCVEMEAYWQLREYLGGIKPALPGGTPLARVKELEKTTQQVTTQKNALAVQVNGLTAAKKIADDKIVKFQGDLSAATMKYEASQTELKKRDAELVKANDQIKTLDGTLKRVGDRLTTAGVKVVDPIKGIDELAADRDGAKKALKGFETRLEAAKYFLPGGDSAALLAALNDAIRVAQMKDPQGEIVKDEREIARLNGVLGERRTPAEMVDLWFPVVADRTQKEAARKSVIDAERALKEPNAKPALKAKATALLGLAQRDAGLFDEARITLAAALKMDVGGEWQSVAVKALEELTRPTEFYLPHARALHDAGKDAEALAALDEALKIFSKDNAPLLALRSLVRLGLARDQAKGKLTPDDVALAKKDADDAVAAGLPEGHFALGRIAEELNDLATARKSYEAARKAHDAPDDEGNRYRVALARVLLKLGTVGKRDLEKPLGLNKPERMSDSLASLILLLQIGAPADANKEAEEANKLADEILASRDTPNSFLFKAQAYAVKGRWNEALKTYVLGLKAHIRRDYADALIDLVNRHPMLRRPDHLEIPDPLRAEAFFTTGLRHFGAKNYLDAEKAFVSAVEADNQDARYFYYLGLTRMALGRRDDATADYQQGAILEAQGKPGRAAVSESLETIQGTPRQTLNSFRP